MALLCGRRGVLACRALIVAGFVLVGSPGARAQTEAVDRGLGFLVGAQRPDGLWAGTAPLAQRHSAAALTTLRLLMPSDAAVGRGVEALLAAPGRTVDMEARRLSVLRPLLPEVVLADALAGIAAVRASDGGWGVAAGFDTSSALDTALAIAALVGTAALPDDDLVRAVARLGALQNPDGGFPRATGEISDLAVSAEALRALAAVSRLGAVETIRQPLVAFLVAAQRLDGGFPAQVHGEASDAATTALVVRALMESGAGVAAAYAPARDFLLAHQQANGSWADDPYATALALLAIGDARADLLVSSVRLTPSTVTRGNSTVVTVTVANLGLAPANSSVALFLSDPTQGAAPVTTLGLPPLAPGAMADVSWELDTLLLLLEDSVPVFAVVDPAGLVPELSEVNNRGVAVLQIVAGTPPGPNKTPVITSTPPNRAFLGTVLTYQIEASDPDGDPLVFRTHAAPPGAIVNELTGLVTWPVVGDAGTRVIFTISAVDPRFYGTTQGFAVDVLAPGTTRPPVFDSFPPSAASVGKPYLYAVRASDPDGGPVTLALAAGPAGMSLDAGTGTLSWTPEAGDAGERVVRLVASDQEGATVEQQWIVVVAPAEENRPDLVPVQVSADDTVTHPQSLRREGTALVTVMNQGTGDAPPSAVWIYEDRDGEDGFGAGDLVLGRAAAPALVAEAQAEVTVPIEETALFRDNRLFALADAEAGVPESREDNNHYASGREKRFVPAQGPFRAAVKWEWNGSPALEAMTGSTPIVAQLDDDNGDGRIDGSDVPEILTVSFTGHLHALDGKTGQLRWSVLESTQDSVP